jgi:hypothetical protein
VLDTTSGESSNSGAATISNGCFRRKAGNPPADNAATRVNEIGRTPNRSAVTAVSPVEIIEAGSACGA